MTNRTGKCALCGSPSNPNGIGGELERCEECKKKVARARRKRWADKNKERETEMKRAYGLSERHKSLRRAQWKASPTRNKKWNAANVDKVRDYKITHKMKKAYGITPEWYRMKFAAQNGVCAICARPSKQRRLHIDHNHQTAALRDLLCVNCNFMLGYGKEDPRIFMAAIDYLVKHGAPGIFKEAV